MERANNALDDEYDESEAFGMGVDMVDLRLSGCGVLPNAEKCRIIKGMKPYIGKHAVE